MSRRDGRLPPPSPTRESCGTCSLCCKVMRVPQLDPPKPSDEWCPHCVPGRLPGGCTIYETRPPICQGFRCLWLMSHTDLDKTPMPMAIRPDSSHVVFGALRVRLRGVPVNDEMATTAHVDPDYPDAWRRWPMSGMLDQMLNQGIIIMVRVGERATLLRKGYAPEDWTGRID